MKNEAMEKSKVKLILVPTTRVTEQNLQGNTKKIRRDIENGDMLSNLPDKVLHHILSFLDTKIAVQTCVLGKRWKYLWQSLSSLHFNSHSFSNPDYYKKFVMHVLLHRDGSKKLHKFTIDYWWCDPILKQVTNYLVSHGCGVQELFFCVYCDMSLSPFLPHLFTWKSLRTLKLEKLVLPKDLLFDFGSLTSLYLKACWLPWEKGDSYDPFRGCLNLKNLRINGCRIWLSVKTFEIYSPQVTDLKISWMDCQGFDAHYNIALSTPKLRSFSFKGPKLIEVSIKCLPLLEKVNVHIGQKFPTVEHSSTENDHKYLVNMLQGLGNAKSFTLSHETIGVLSKAPDVVLGHCSPLTRVDDVKVKVRFGTSSKTIPSFTLPLSVINYLLSGSPSAKAIVIEHSNVKGEAEIPQGWHENRCSDNSLVDYSVSWLKFEVLIDT